MPRAFDTATGIPRFIGGLRAYLSAKLSRPAMNRRVLRRLSHMSDRELAASGLVRQDVVEASAAKTRDPMDLLLDRRDERRASPRR